MVVHVTTVKRLGGPRGTAGLKRTSIAKCQEVYTLWKQQLDASAGRLPATIMRKIDRALAIALHLSLERY